MLQFKVRSHYSYSRSREETNTLRKLCSPETGQVPIHQLTSAQPANRMDLKTKWFVFGLLSFALGSMVLAGYFLTPGYKSEDNNQDNADINNGPYSFSDKHYARPFGVSLMIFGFLVVLVVLGIEHDSR